MITRAFKRAVAFLVSACLVAAGLPARSARAGGAGADSSAPAVVSETPADGHFLRDAVASAGFAAQPPDTVTDDDFYLPEETDKKKLYRDIAVFVVAAAFVAYFIIKVFIEKDEEPADDGNGGKDVPPPE